MALAVLRLKIFVVTFSLLCHAKANNFSIWDHIWDHNFVVTANEHGHRALYIKKFFEIMNVTNWSFISGPRIKSFAENKSHPLWSVVNVSSIYTFGEIACAFAHRRVYEVVTSMSLEHALVIEDDILFLPEFTSTVTRLRPYIQRGWKIIHWHTQCDTERLNHSGCGPYLNMSSMGRVSVSESLVTSVHPVEYFGTVCYEINSASAAELLKLSTPIRLAADGPVSMLYGFGITYTLMSKECCLHPSWRSRSIIEEEDSKFNQSRNTRVLGY